MKRTFVLNLLLLLILNLLVKPFWIFGIDRVVQIEVGEAEYGLYYALFNFSFLFNILLDAGITNFNNRHIAQNKQLLNKHFSWILSTKLILGLGYFIVTLVGALILGYDKGVMPMLIWLMVNQFLASLILYLRSNVSGLLLFKQDSILSVLDRVLMIGIVGTLLYGGVSKTSFNIMWFVYAQTVAYVFTAITALVVVLMKAKKIELRFRPIVSLAILKQSLPFALLILLMTLYSRTDAIMIERILPNGAFETGIYAQGYRLLDALNNIAYLFAALLLPMFSKLAKENKSAKEIINVAQNLLIPGALFIALICWFYKAEIMDLLYPGAGQATNLVFGILMLGFVAMSFNYIYGTLLTANNCLRWLNYMAVSALIINVVINLCLIPLYGAFGAAIATVITQFFTVIIHGYLVSKKRYYQFKVSLIVKWSLFVCVLIIAHLIIANFSLGYIYEIGVLSGGAVLLFISLGFINNKQIVHLIKSRNA